MKNIHPLGGGGRGELHPLTVRSAVQPFTLLVSFLRPGRTNGARENGSIHFGFGCAKDQAFMGAFAWRNVNISELSQNQGCLIIFYVFAFKNRPAVRKLVR